MCIRDRNKYVESRIRNWDEISFTKVDLGVKIRVNLLMFTAGRQTTGFHVLDSIWTTSRACVVAFNSPWSLPVGRCRSIRRQCLRSLLIQDHDAEVWILSFGKFGISMRLFQQAIRVSLTASWSRPTQIFNQLSSICKFQVSNLWTFNGIFSAATTRALIPEISSRAPLTEFRQF